MAPKGRRSPAGSKVPEAPEVLYRVFRIEDGQLAYLPVSGSRGLPLEEAERLSRQLAVPTEVREVWRREEASGG